MFQFKALLALSVFCFVSTKRHFETCTIYDRIDGCTTPLWLPAPFKTDFTPFCNSHDACYRCGVYYGWKQEACDETFKQSMYGFCRKVKAVKNYSWEEIKDLYKRLSDGWKKITEKVSSKEVLARLWKEALEITKMSIAWFGISDPRLSCFQAANIYHKVVRTFGVFVFRQSVKLDCSERCVRRLGRPKFH